MERYWVSNSVLLNLSDHLGEALPSDKFTPMVKAADAQATIAALQARVRTATQLIIAEIGASGPEDLEEAVGRIVGRLQQRTEELEAANRKSDDLMKIKVSEMEFIADEQNRLETLINDTQAELERVSLLSSHNERRFEMLEKKYKELRTLILALPRMEGDVEVYHHESGLRHSVVARPANKYYSSFDTPEEAGAYAAILKHRQGMEG